MSASPARTFIKAAIVGAGGIGTHVIPLLSRMMDVVIVDGDTYSPDNHSRQFPSLTSSGNKAEVLRDMIQPFTRHAVSAIPEFLKGSGVTKFSEFAGVDLLIGGVDNNKSRMLIMDLADQLEIPAILAGNEHAHGEAHLFLAGVHDPRNHFEFPLNEPVPWGCNTDKVLEEFPQTAIANMLAASATLHVLHSLQSASDPINAVAYTRLDTFFAQSKRVRDFTHAEAAA